MRWNKLGLGSFWKLALNVSSQELDCWCFHSLPLLIVVLLILGFLRSWGLLSDDFWRFIHLGAVSDDFLVLVGRYAWREELLILGYACDARLLRNWNFRSFIFNLLRDRYRLRDSLFFGREFIGKWRGVSFIASELGRLKMINECFFRFIVIIVIIF
jgi:hypothetical protein